LAAPKLEPRDRKYLAQTFDFLVPRIISCTPLSGNHPDVLLAFEVSMLVHFLGPALEDDGFQSFHQFANAGQQQI
jgi:hypothetical protein